MPKSVLVLRFFPTPGKNRLRKLQRIRGGAKRKCVSADMLRVAFDSTALSNAASSLGRERLVADAARARRMARLELDAGIWRLRWLEKESALERPSDGSCHTERPLQAGGGSR